MGEVVNLRTERKRKRRERDADKATEQRALHGLTKGERSLEGAHAERVKLNLDQHRLDTGDRE